MGSSGKEWRSDISSSFLNRQQGACFIHIWVTVMVKIFLFPIKILILKVIGIEVLRRGLGHDPHEGISTFIEIPESLLAADTRKCPLWGSQISPDTESTSTLTLNFSDSRTVRNIFLLFIKSSSLWCFCYNSPKGTRQLLFFSSYVEIFTS